MPTVTVAPDLHDRRRAARGRSRRRSGLSLIRGEDLAGAGEGHDASVGERSRDTCLPGPVPAGEQPHGAAEIGAEEAGAVLGDEA